MSHAIRYVGDAPVGAGIQTATGNIGGAIGPDGAQNLNIIGIGDITVIGNPATNTLAIGSVGVANTYITDAGNAVPALGNLNVVGTANEVDTAGAGNTITIGLPANVTIANDLTVTHDLDVGNDLDVTGNADVTGDITGNDITANNTLIVTNGITVNAGGLTVNGPIDFVDAALPRGVMQIDNVGNVFSNEGTDGQLLVSSSLGAPAWANITSAGGTIAVTNGNNTINLEIGDYSGLTFQAKDVSHANPVAAVIRLIGDANINSIAAVNVVTFSLANDITIGNDLTVTRDLTVNRNADVTGDIGVIGEADLNDLSVVGVSTFHALAQGVVQVNAANVLTSSNATAQGQILIGRPGTNAVWNRLTAGAGIAIDTSVADNITITSTGNGLGFTSYLAAPTALIWGLTANYWLGSITNPLTTIYDSTGGFYGGNGAGAPATFTAPYTGLYEFNITARIYIGPAYTAHTNMDLQYTIDVSRPITFTYNDFLTRSHHDGVYYGRRFVGQYIANIYLNAGEIVRFGISAYRTSATIEWGLYSDTFVSGFMC